ncbi:MAG: hypothetical protein FWC65_01455, partial [Treponema sp.]|nr:hypothetical protein [Treponema sp.]
GSELDEGSFVPVLGSAQARDLVLRGLAVEPQHDDSINLLMNRVSSTLDLMNEAFGIGTDDTELGMLARSLRRTMAGAETLPQTLEETIAGIDEALSPILRNIDILTAELADPDGLFLTVMDIDGDVYANLSESLASISSILDSLDRAAAFVPAQLPQIAGLIVDLRGTMRAAEDVLVALTNNPLLRRGVPGRPESESGGANPRNIRF